MGFWSSFFGSGMAYVYNERKKSEKETQKWNDLFYEISDYEENFNNFLKSVGINDTYVFDVEYINSGNIMPIKHEIDNLRKKVNEYLSLGGQGEYVVNLNAIDECINKVKYLKQKGCLKRQQEFKFNDLNTVKLILEEEYKYEQTRVEEKQTKQFKENLKEQEKEMLLCLKNNDLNAVLSEKYEYNSNEVIKIDCVQVLTKDIARQWIKNNDVDFELELLTVNLILTKSSILICDWATNSQIYYRSSLTKNKSILVEYMLFLDDSVSIVKFGELFLYMSTDNVNKLCNIFKGIKKENLFNMQDINTLSGVEFEKVCQKIVEKMGFETETTKASGDGGIDLIAYNHQPLLSGKYIIQCKRYTGSVGEPIIRDLYGVVMSERANKGILMTTGTFTKNAINFANGKPIELIDGNKLHGLLNTYRLAECDNMKEIDNRTPKDIFANNIMIEDEYRKYENNVKELNKTNDEVKRANFINWLINLTMGDFADISDFKEKIIIFKEIKEQIRKYINGNRIEKSKLLSYLYQMIYVQLSILEGDFNEARNMFENLMQHKELQLSLMKTIKESPDEIHITDILYDHEGIFTWLCYTWYDMIQVAILVNDTAYKMYITDHNLFYGFPVLETNRLKRTIKQIDSGSRAVGNRNYFAERLYEFEEIDSLIYDDVPLRRLYLMNGYELEVYYKYTYENGDYFDFAPDSYKLLLDENILKIDRIGEIENIKQKINKWTFSV